jgi:HSP20 family protein
MARTRANPFRGLHDFFTEMERMRRHGRSGADVGGGRAEIAESEWVPPADIFAVGADIVIRMEIPGVKPGDIDITFGEGLLTISGERDSDLPDDVTFYTRERRQGPFHRSMLLPEGIDTSMIAASFEDGITEITVTGAARAPEASRIPIKDRSSRRATRSAAPRRR